MESIMCDFHGSCKTCMEEVDTEVRAHCASDSFMEVILYFYGSIVAPMELTRTSLEAMSASIEINT